MKTPCIKVVSEERYQLQSFGPGLFSQVYREKDGAINTVKSSLVFTEPEDAARFIVNHCPSLLMKQVWIASADSIEPRDWVFTFSFLDGLRECGNDPAVLRMKEIVLQCSSKTERPEDDKELSEAFNEMKKVLEYWMPIRVLDAPIGTALATNLKLEECIDFPKKSLTFEKMVERISKAFNDFNENLIQMTEKDTPQ